MTEKQVDQALRKKYAALEREAAELRRSNEQYRQLVENLNEVIYTLDREARVTYISPNIERISGYTPEEITGRSFTDFVHPEDLAARSKNFQRVLSGEDLVTEYRYLLKNGQSIWVRTNARPIITGGELTGIQGMLVDIADHKKYETVLIQSEKKFRDIFDNTADAIFIHDLCGRIIEVNAAACKLMGYTRQEMLQMQVKELVSPAYTQRVPQNMERTKQAGRNSFESVHRRKDGIEIPVEVSTRKIEYEGRPCILGVSRDITERKMRENVLRESEWQKDLILNSANEKIIYLDNDLRIIWANRSSAGMAGLSEEEMSGRRCYELWWQRRTPCPDCLIEKARDQRAPQKEEKTHPDGRCHIRRAYPSIDDTGEVSGIILFAEDITERKKAEEEKMRLEAQFQQSQKLESIGRLAGGVAHDLNNLLSPILGYGEMLMASEDKDEGRKKQLGHIVEAGTRARAMVRQLLAFSRQQMLEFKNFDLNRLIKDFEKLLRHTLRENIVINIHPAASLPPINGDAGQIEQIIMNLAINAQDAMPHGGVLGIETRPVELDAFYADQRNGVSPGSYAMLMVSDTGDGMDRETANKVFEPFFTTKEKDKGTGLGLSTAYGIVKQHGGNIWVYSEPGLGTTFKVYLPVARKEERRIEEVAQKMKPQTKASEALTVLLAEDEAVVRDLVVSMLEMQGYTVLVGESGREALSIINHHEGPVDLLLTDVIMPDMSGKDLHGQLSHAFPNLRTIFMSGYTENIIAYHGVLDPEVNFLQKPFTVKDLNDKIREVLHQ